MSDDDYHWVGIAQTQNREGELIAPTSPPPPDFVYEHLD